MFILSCILLISTLLLAQSIKKSRSCAGVSLKTQILFAIVYSIGFIVDTSRLLGNAESDYLDLLDYLVNLNSLGAIYFVIYLIAIKYKHSYDRNHDSFRISFIIIPSFLLSLLFFNGDNGEDSSYLLEILSTFSYILNCFAILPQYIQLKRTGDIDTLTPNYIVTLTVYRVFNWTSLPSLPLLIIRIAQIAFDILNLYQFFKIPNYTISLS
ncbi:hypothetical protein PPL_11992 [Heterostelium album PN500]|uniref:Uncharacterized protein n=1 Tax=Heterostelium pallidum (strain ATCC 26659 / Pp 5 / PN500) TaxID=670386 RepID=D3BV20_HETP5|nr:hypothetical protein PPL_11992 [Heterostelium album PN500]EFA74958.1 hypothetical protein PPL_11992 [Heterostelium album PN500]|eukprot:XP_020427092.1 hypothetical protein PPL_11992 [Heterostelium album PN500]